MLQVPRAAEEGQGKGLPISGGRPNLLRRRAFSAGRLEESVGEVCVAADEAFLRDCVAVTRMKLEELGGSMVGRFQAMGGRFRDSGWLARTRMEFCHT
jgi:hypothetical protein